MPYRRSAEAFELVLDENPLNPAEVIRRVAHPDSGASVIFLGTVRRHHQGRRVTALAYEAQPELALNELQRIVEDGFARWPLQRAAVHHRLGKLQVGEIAVVIGVSAGHRKDAFEAGRFLLDRLKASVPIWKQEFYAEGSRWIGDPQG